jgi:CubicO group peptidase (beta-lactamase class C family)/uncharacterized protein YneR
MSFKPVFLFVVASLIFCSAALAQQSNQQQLSSSIDKILEGKFNAGTPGTAVLVAKNGEIIYQKAFGMANLELEVPMHNRHVFRIGSITKQFTAVAILQLMEQGLLSLDDDITRFFPEYPVHEHKITIHHLLTHTSGIASYTNLREWTPEFRRQDLTPDEMIDWFKDQPMDFEPGEQWNYNNSGYFLLGRIIELVSGKSYAAYIEENLFRPAGMSNSLYGDDKILVSHRASGYQQLGNGFENADFLSMSQPYAAGALMMNIEDLYKWNRALISGKLISGESRRLAWENYTLNNGKPVNYGYGWTLGDVQGFQMTGHGGGINGFLTHEAWFPEKDIFVAMFVNCTCIGTDAAHEIAALALGRPFSYREIEITAAEVEEYIGVYENENGNQRVIYVEAGQLISRRIGGGTYRIIPFEKDKFFFEDSFTSIEFNRNANREVKGAIMKTTTGFPEKWNKTDQPLPELSREISLPAELLQTYVGKYELMPGFILTITLEDGKLMTQATGQDKFEVFAESEDNFFLKVVDARIQFIKGADSTTTSLILRQSGMEIEGQRID